MSPASCAVVTVVARQLCSIVFVFVFGLCLTWLRVISPLYSLIHTVVCIVAAAVTSLGSAG